MTGIAISQTGVMSFQYTNGASVNAYIIPLGRCAEPRQHDVPLGDAYTTNYESGPIQLNNADTAGSGHHDSSSLEILHGRSRDRTDEHDRGAERLRSQFKVFQTGTDIFDVLNNLKS